MGQRVRRGRRASDLAIGLEDLYDSFAACSYLISFCDGDMLSFHSVRDSRDIRCTSVLREALIIESRRSSSYRAA